MLRVIDEAGHAASASGEGLPARIRGAVRRLAREPGEAARRAADVHERIEAVRLLAEQAATATEVAHRLSQQIDQLRTMMDAQEALITERWRHLGITTAALIEATAPLPGPPRDPDAGPLVSIVLPVRDRAGLLCRAVDSVLAQTHLRWELLLVDDGSTDDPEQALAWRADDPRITLLRTNGVGAAAARNHAVSVATGELVTFLDSDNWWYPHRLATVVDRWDDTSDWLVDQQLVLAKPPAAHHVRDIDRPLTDLREANFIDLGAVVVTRQALLRLVRPGADGPFDAELPRLSDWDLIRRLAASGAPTRVGAPLQVYDDTGTDRISHRVPYGPAYHRVRGHEPRGAAAGLRILVSEWHFPQVTETYIQADIAGLLAHGAEVEVWSDDDVAVCYDPKVPWRRGPLRDHLEEFRPDLVLTHWLHIGRDHREVIRPFGVPHAVRCHGFDFDAEVVRGLAAEPDVAVHLFDHLTAGLPDRPNVHVHPVAFDPERIRPTDAKDRRLVVRLSAGLHTKDLEVFMRAAALCPEFRFVLGIGHTHLVTERTEELIAIARSLGSPIEIVTDLGYEEAAQLTMDAGLYLHTHGTDHTLGMPISPIEAMASGSYVLARHLPGSDYLHPAASRYDGATAAERADRAAALVNATLGWDEEQWAERTRASLDLAWTRHPADLVAEDLIATWRRQFSLPVR